MATVLVDVRPPQYTYTDEFQRLQVQRPSAHNKSNDSVSTPAYERNQSDSQDPAALPPTSGPRAQDDFSSAKETANTLMAETDAETSGYVGTQLNVFA